MHAEAYAGFGWALSQSGIDRHAPLRVLDLGGQNVNGTVHDYFTHPDTIITTVDLENADVLADITVWRPPAGDPGYDVVTATEVFEHVEDWRAVMDTAEACLKDGGVFIATCASTNRPEHGATGAPAPAPGEWYRNVGPEELEEAVRNRWRRGEVTYKYPPGDAYLWAGPSRLADVTVIIPTIRGRAKMLQEAVESVQAQTVQARRCIIVEDEHGEGPAVVRNRGLEDAETEWVAFLDDDDLLLPGHLATLLTAAESSGADVIWPWFRVDGGTDPFPMHRGRQWDPEDPHQIPITVLIRTAALRAVGGFRTVTDGPTDKDGNRAGEDFDLWLRLSAAGYRFHHVNEVTWTWRHHRGNTSGLPSRVR